MRPITGYATVTDPDAPLLERDTVSCGHCQRVIFVKPNSASTIYLIFNRQTWRWDEVPGAGCFRCGRPVCLTCCANGRCTPWEQRLAASEARDRLRRAVTG